MTEHLFCIPVSLSDTQEGGVNAGDLHRLGRHLRDVTEHIEFQSNPGAPRSDRDMTFEEKRKLSVFISEMDGDKLENVLEIVSQDQQEGLPGKNCSSQTRKGINTEQERQLKH